MTFKAEYFLLFFMTASVGCAALSVSPTQVSTADRSPVFTITGAGTQGVTWSLSPNLGSISTTSSRAVYTPPPGLMQAQTVNLTATDIVNRTLVAKASINVFPNITVTIQPSVVDITGAGTQAFTATVSSTTNTAVRWSVNSILGTVSSSGVFTTPGVSVDTNVTLTATSLANSRKFGTALIRLHAPNIKFTTQANGLQSVIFNGADYNYLYGEDLVTSLTSLAPGGTPNRFAPTCRSVFDAVSVTKTCTGGSTPVTVRVDYSTPDSSTLTAVIKIVNNGTTDTITDAQLSVLGVDVPQYDLSPAKSRVLTVDGLNPISYVNYLTGQWAIWNNAPSPDVVLNVTCGWTTFCKNQPDILNILPGQTKTASFSLRFTPNPALASIDFAPEAYTAFNKAYPSVVNWPDRRPIMAWFISDYSKSSAINPRGYLQQPTLDVSNVPNFTTQVLGQAQTIIGLMKARPVQPQGLLIWDLEGQEFIQATTYVGDPRILSKGYAPEMDATADQLFALFKNAGYKVGITLRPQQLQWGTQLPSTCQYDIDNDFKDYYIKVNNPFGQRFFACYDPAGVNWSLIPQGNGGQTFYQSTQPNSVTALLMSKVAYAHARWGTTLYYVDTAVWHGGAPLPADTFRQLQLAFPDSIFIPEQSSLPTMGVSLPFSDPKNSSAPTFAPVSWRYVYPNDGLGVYLANCQGTCWTNNYNDFVVGQRVGDMAIYPQPTQMSLPQLQQIESMILSARSQTSSITVTDSSTGASYSYQGAASTIYQYPVKMRVYFAPSPAQAALSTTFCESGQWLGQNTCSLNLSGLLTAQVRYYDFAGNLVLSQTPGPR